MVALAKPSGITLRDHVSHVQKHAIAILTVWPFLAEKYARLTNGKSLKDAVEKAIKWHDEGKRIDNWQAACQKDYAQYQEWLKTKNLDPLRIDATLYQQYEWEMKQQNKATGKHLRDAKFRHEFGSLKLAADKKAGLSVEEQTAIAAHHGKLGKRHLKRWESDGGGAFLIYWSKFINQERDQAKYDLDRWGKLLLARYEIAAVRSLLQLADTRASREESEGELAPLTEFDYEFPHGKGNERGVQKAAMELADQWCSILRAPTGSGKTDAALLWGQQQIENKRADRLIIAMPTRFTSNALALNIEKNVRNTGLYHSSARFTQTAKVQKDGKKISFEQKQYLNEQQRLAQLLATPVTVCTVDHLLISLTGAAEHHHSSFFFLANSAVVFDEADFYDPFVQANLTVLLKALRILHVPVLIMSATVPDSACALYDVPQGIKEPILNEEPPKRALAWAGKPTTVQVGETEYSDLPVTEKAKDVADVLQKMVDARHGIIYANTVERALMYYDWFNENAPNQEIILYHSRFTEPDKGLIEDRLLKTLGKDIWTKPNPTPLAIAILTQIGEMSVNISASIMLSDLCPWDRLTQRLGRLNRFGKPAEAVAYLTIPYKKEAVYVAPYGELIDRKWVPAPAFINTLASVVGMIPNGGLRPIKPAELVDVVNALYPDLPAFPEKAADNRDQLYNLMNQNWLIVPDRRLDEEAGTVSTAWRSRDIDEHRTILTRSPYDFKNYEEYQAFVLEFGVSCPVWMVEKEERRKENSRITVVEVLIDDEPEKLRYTDEYESWTEQDEGRIEGYVKPNKPKRGMAFLYDKKDTTPNDDDD
ncbi:CRISPR-associated helicase Cas3' [Spirosoma pollinicola]|uniref:CRISPR-associated helicase Cas3 n=1 Tax=Spirosoma pollinicola TaxID=2057025 RepID=A0A2K8YWV1_9BACT|nr:CRISPR-associated helicase Cas3' [Spirosoma pollinicola]AUD02102.1 CRISPR-associated helicase Cas3' [Spirosoma pollinicola]